MNEERGHFVILLEKFFIELKDFQKDKQRGQDRLEYLIQNKIIDESINQKYLINSKKIIPEFDVEEGFEVYEHEKIPYISYPYEWSFSQLKSAAIHHLDFHLFLLEKNATLIDASAYNIQFIGSQPIFIDLYQLKNMKMVNIGMT